MNAGYKPFTLADIEALKDFPAPLTGLTGEELAASFDEPPANLEEEAPPPDEQT